MKVEAKKKFGQNFISDQNLITKIISILGEDKDQLIIEIGPGTGALTKQLVEKYNKVVAIEIDTDMEPILKSAIPNKNFELFLSDVLLVDFTKLIKEHKQHENQKVSIISNMPYYITSEILFRTLNVSENLNKAVFMMQKEVAVRVCSYKGENNYNNLSVACEFFADKKYEFTVPKHMFYPVPKVDSAIISLTFTNKHTKEIENKEDFLAFLRKIFNNRRKTILNNLSNVTNDKMKANLILDKVKIDKTLRPEVVGLEDFIKIFKKL
ncbi:16S rRNA (adenine(1518)-N(6)/adenine(1519)-N(6))-dimethyltransferase RsmA [Mesoplasma chauliocola]|uniref:Ribosomal RNA small subunit methyltransferase A n=1 Tax=Mesoplasma chauliocola TaxID=216427 RepID=A0A249SME0_9MOLU|nr:16S rRNA (adenine(1518)-N(6)/adenine(1519)-N(6))-dimethyltransferase RsmA [Mesoplasma chauliocola]ASZ08759.1 16S rRNA (adenine(1518)-N(6)/adenine(1519)-N(6))-dimethyltransferase RsmA [Mesoplasma chauliocola]